VKEKERVTRRGAVDLPPPELGETKEPPGASASVEKVQMSTKGRTSASFRYTNIVLGISR